MVFKYALIYFDSKERFINNGVPARLIPENTNVVVYMKADTILKNNHSNRFSKVEVHPNSKDSKEAQLVELLGPPGCYDSELQVYQFAYGIKPCKYPQIATSEIAEKDHFGRKRVDITESDTFSVDNPGTRDIDDAISFHEIRENVMRSIFSDEDVLLYSGKSVKVVGVHITDLASKLKDETALLSWAQARASSSYFQKNGELQSIPMLPHALAHGMLSLNENETRNAISLFAVIDLEQNCILEQRHAFTIVKNKRAMSYQAWEVPVFLSSICESKAPEDAIAWLMILYNKYFGRMFAMNFPNAILRIQEENAIAEYKIANNQQRRNFHFGLQCNEYAHVTSPIRRFADMYNQCILYGKDSPIDVDSLNAKMNAIQEFHNKIAISHLSYHCREAPYRCSCDTRFFEDGQRILRIRELKVKIPFHDSYYAETIAQVLEREDDVCVELFGVMDQGLMKLRLRLVEEKPWDQQATWDEQIFQYCQKWKIPSADRLSRSGLGLQLMKFMSADELQRALSCSQREAMDIQTAFQHRSSIGVVDIEREVKLEASEVNRILGYPIDSFQTKCLDVIKNPESDLLAMAPTGSGKTAVALISILQAFKTGRTAVYTSPIKALSNQKYGEFTEWFRERDIDASVTLLTGDIRIQGDPSSKYRLVICTSEIMRNKLSNCGADDKDIENVGCLVSDEVHYINDPDRGSVWEETIVHLPHSVQLVALSATLQHPEQFSQWITSIRKRSISLVTRNDRHVPLHVGGINEGKFVEYYGTHGPAAGTFAEKAFTALGKRTKLLARDSMTAKAHHLARQKEKEGFTQKNKDYRRKTESRDTYSFSAECIRVAKELRGCGMLPSIVFCMSRKKCMEGALNLISYSVIDDEEKKRIQQAVGILERKYLRRFEDLKTLSLYSDFMRLIHNGICYHHSGMLPVLREFVELCFQQKLIKIVFATESLGIGVNMPARSVVFSQVDKPMGTESSKRLLRTDEFWQMAGRAGRRGMDSVGYVIYDPFLLQSHVSSLDMNHILTGALPSVKSKLNIDNAFVLRTLNNSSDVSVLRKTLLFTQNERESSQIRCEVDCLGVITEEMEAYHRLKTKLDGDKSSGVVISLSAKGRKETEQKIRQLEKEDSSIAASFQLVETRNNMLSALSEKSSILTKRWSDCMGWLTEHNFIQSGLLTPRGKCCALFADGQPIVMGTIISDGWFSDANVTQYDMYAWVALFLHDWQGSFQSCTSNSFEEILDETKNLSEIVDFKLNVDFANAVYHWSKFKDLRKIMESMDVHMTGSFVKGIMRVASQIEIVRKAFMGLMMYDAHSKLDHFMTDLMGGIVTNESLYLN